MKTKLSYLFITIGLLTILGQTFYRVQREKKLLEVQMQVQRASLVEGLNTSWRSFLLRKAQQGELTGKYILRWNRKGSELREVFFPMKKANLNWAKFREYQKSNNKSAATDFLKLALSRNNSWDRVLAITEWKNINGSFSKTKTEYEKTLVNPEAKNAYRAIFEQFSENKDFTFASNKIELDKVFYKVTDDGSIEAFVPSIGIVRDELLPEFIKRNNLPSAGIGGMPWELSLPGSLTEEQPFSYFDFIWIAFGMLLLASGMVVYFGGLREQKLALLKRVSFLNQVVHELKTPLAGLKLHLQLIQRGSGTEQNMMALNTSLDRLNKLFDDVVLMNKPFEKVTTERLSAQELESTINDLVEEFSQANIEKFSGDDVLADAKRLRVILRNLVKNAIRYGKVAKISVSKNEAEVFIDVQDEGPGVSEIDSQKIFEEFYRSEEAKIKNADGLGLGLFLVSKMAKEMGAIAVLRNPGQPGAVFRLILRRPS
jgi:signal transduction histidine kinase